MTYTRQREAFSCHSFNYQRDINSGSTFHLCNKLPNTRVSAPGGYSYKFSHSCHHAGINIATCCKDFQESFRKIQKKEYCPPL